jgi:hypothetical protein
MEQNLNFILQSLISLYGTTEARTAIFLPYVAQSVYHSH